MNKDIDRSSNNAIIRYYVCGLGYDINNHMTDYEHIFGVFDDYNDSYKLFNELNQKKYEQLFDDESVAIPQLLIHIEECEEIDGEIRCIDIKNQSWFISPNFSVYFKESII